MSIKRDDSHLMIYYIIGNLTQIGDLKILYISNTLRPEKGISRMKVCVIFIAILIALSEAKDKTINGYCPENCSCSAATKITMKSGQLHFIPTSEMHITCKITQHMYGIDKLPNNITHLTIDGRCHEAPSRYNCIHQLEKDVLSNFTNLKFLTIRNTNIQTLPEGIFDALTNLSYMNLDNNPLIFHSELMLFSRLKKLGKLSITGSDFTFLGKPFFHGLKKLHTLKLNNNSLRSFGDYPFKHMPVLITIHRFVS